MVVPLVAFQTFPKQTEFVNAVLSQNYDLVLYGGAIKGGKTIVGIATLILLCRLYPGSHWAIVRATMPDIERNVFDNLDKVLPSNFVKKDRRYSNKNPRIEFLNGSKILFFPENFTKDKDLNRWKGLDVNGFLLEEMNEIQKKSFFKAIERAGTYIIPGQDKKQPKPIILATCNPSRGYVKELIYDLWENGTLRPNWCYIPANIFDNPYVSDEKKEQLKQLPKYEYQVFVEGNWNINLKTGAEFLKSFELDLHLGNTAFDPDRSLHVSLDENVHPYISCTLWQIHNDNTKICQVAEILGKSPNNTVFKAGKMLKKFLQQNKFKDIIYLYGDRTSLKQDTKIEKGKNFFRLFENELNDVYTIRRRLPSVNPSVSLSGAFVNEILENNFDGLTIEINEIKCKESINDYIETKENADGGILKVKIKDSETGITYEKNGHLTDTLRYFICEAFKQSYTRYQTKGIEHARILSNYRQGQQK